MLLFGLTARPCSGFAPPLLLGQNRVLMASGSSVNSLQHQFFCRVRPGATQQPVRMASSTGGEVDAKRIATYFGATGAEVVFLTAAMGGNQAGIKCFAKFVEY